MIQQRALIIDPDATRRSDLADGLAKTHFETVQAADGNEGLKQIEAFNPDIIFCDAAITGHSAKELCEYVAEFVSGRLAFVLMVDSAEPDPERLRRQTGADGVLRHPVAHYELANLGRHLLSLLEVENRLRHLMDENRSLREALAQKALIDPVTRFYRFDVFKQMIVLEVKRAKRYGYPLSILLLAFDNFAKVSGWLTPEQRRGLYKHLRREVTECIRDIDIPLLFAEERVLVVMPHTDLAGAAVVADRIRDRISAIKPPGSLAELRLSVSLSVASTERAEMRTFGTLIREAMRGLKEAEFKGGDVVLVCRSPEGEEGENTCIEVDGKLGPRTFFV